MKKTGSLITLIIVTIITIGLLIYSGYKLYQTYIIRSYIESNRAVLPADVYNYVLPSWWDYVGYGAIMIASLVLLVWGIYQYFRDPSEDLEKLNNRYRFLNVKDLVENAEDGDL